MKLTNLALVPALVLSFAAVTAGCANDKYSDDTSTPGSATGSTPGSASGSTSDGATLGTDAEQLVADDSEAADTDDTLEAGVDDPLSGSDPADPGNPADGASDDDLLGKVITNAAKHYLGKCLASTRDGNKIHHVFHACRTPWSLKTFDGTIDSTYVRDGNKLTITHEYNGFLADGATISGTRVIEYTRSVDASSKAVTVAKHRTGTFTGSTKKGHDLSHTADFSSTYDDATKCMTRAGSAQTTIGGRLFERVLTDYERCGIGEGGCPSAGGKLALSRSNAKGTDSVSIDFLGGDAIAVTPPDGKVVDRTITCNQATD